MAISKTRAGHFIPTEIQKQGEVGLLKIGYPWVPQNPKVDHQCPVVKTAIWGLPTSAMGFGKAR